MRVDNSPQSVRQEENRWLSAGLDLCCARMCLWFVDFTGKISAKIEQEKKGEVRISFLGCMETGQDRHWIDTLIHFTIPTYFSSMRALSIDQGTSFSILRSGFGAIESCTLQACRVLRRRSSLTSHGWYRWHSQPASPGCNVA